MGDWKREGGGEIGRERWGGGEKKEMRYRGDGGFEERGKQRQRVRKK